MKFQAAIKELHADDDKVLTLKARRLVVNDQIKLLQADVSEAQVLLDQAHSRLRRKKKTYQLLDKLNAEFEFSLKQKAETQAKAQRQQASRKQSTQRATKTAAQTMSDVMDCLAALPEDQRQAVLAAMKQNQ
jgi:hypothetical protein